MERHHEKRQDMARSILPSKNRETARGALARAKRSNRRAVSQELKAFRSPYLAAAAISPEVYDAWDERDDVGRYPYVEIRSTVLRRRDGDKLNHFMRWAIASMADVPIDDRLSQLRSVLAGGLIGDHAMTHLVQESGLRRVYEHERRFPRVRQSVRESQRKAHLAAEFDVLHVVLHEVVTAPGGLKHLNRVMKSCDRHATYGGCAEAHCVKRCLGGLHDIEAFLRDVYRPTGRDRRPDAPECLPARRFRAYLLELRDAADLDW